MIESMEVQSGLEEYQLRPEDYGWDLRDITSDSP